LPAHILERQAPLAQSPFNALPSVGDGPYLVAAWQRGNGLRYHANPRYWRGIARTATLDVRVATDPGTNLVMLRTGSLDWNLIAPAQFVTVKDDARLQFVSVPTAVVAALAMNTGHAPLDDVRVRRALAQSIDRNAISAKITLGKYPVADSLQPRFSWAYDPSVHQPGFDPAAADRAFDIAGWTRGSDGMRARNGVALRLTYVQFPESMTGVRVATLIQEELRQRGVDVVIKSVANAQLFLPKTGTLATGNFDLAYVPFTMGADPDDSFVLACDAASNYMRWCDRRVDSLEDRALVSVARSERVAAYRQVAAIVAREVPLLYLFDADYIYASRKQLQGFAPNAFLPTWNAWAWHE
jgi:peptide/nickel transport system substrate-binding protein